MGDNFRGLLLHMERLRCHVAGICAVTVLAEDSHCSVRLQGLEQDLPAVTFLREAELNAIFHFHSKH